MARGDWRTAEREGVDVTGIDLNDAGRLRGREGVDMDMTGIVVKVQEVRDLTARGDWQIVGGSARKRVIGRLGLGGRGWM